MIRGYNVIGTISHFKLDHVYLISGVTHHMLPHFSGVPHLHVN